MKLNKELENVILAMSPIYDKVRTDKTIDNMELIDLRDRLEEFRNNLKLLHFEITDKIIENAKLRNG